MSRKSTPVFGFIFKALIESFQFFHVMICNGSVKVEPPLDALRHFEKPILGSGSVCLGRSTTRGTAPSSLTPGLAVTQHNLARYSWRSVRTLWTWDSELRDWLRKYAQKRGSGGSTLTPIGCIRINYMNFYISSEIMVKLHKLSWLCRC